MHTCRFSHMIQKGIVQAFKRAQMHKNHINFYFPEHELTSRSLV